MVLVFWGKRILRRLSHIFFSFGTIIFEGGLIEFTRIGYTGRPRAERAVKGPFITQEECIFWLVYCSDFFDVKTDISLFFLFKFCFDDG